MRPDKLITTKPCSHALNELCGEIARYILSHIEHFGKMRAGDRVFQLGFGGGFKCNSAVWRARRAVKQHHSCWVDDEDDCMHEKYERAIPEMGFLKEMAAKLGREI